MPQSGELLARLLDTIDFRHVLEIIAETNDGYYRVLPYITVVKTTADTIDLDALKRCCRVTTLILPRCSNINDNTLYMLPYIESLTISSCAQISSTTLRDLPYLKKLQIMSSSGQSTSFKLDPNTLSRLTQLEMLHMRDTVFLDDSLYSLKNLKVIVLDNTEVTPAILNYLPKLELCILNYRLYKYVASTTNAEILKKVGKLQSIKIYSIQ